MDIELLDKLNNQIKQLESWDAQLFFPPEGPDNEKVDLCLFLRLFCSGVDTYQFNTQKYVG